MKTLEFGIVLGLLVGSLYALLAIGLVLVFKATKVLNLAHGQIGASAVLVLVELVLKTGMPYLLALVIALASGVLVGVGVEVLYVHALRRAAGLVTMVATLAIGQVLAGTTSLLISPTDQAKLGLSDFPQPLHLRWVVAGVSINGSGLVTLLVVPALAVALGLFFRYARYGIAIRAAADDEDNARLLSISPRRVSLTAWGLAGGLSALAAILIDGVKGSGSDFSFGPGLLLRALAPALIARLSSLPLAAAAGLGIGVLDQVATAETGNATVSDAALFLVVLVSLFTQRTAAGRAGDVSAVSFPVAAAARRISSAAKASTAYRRSRRGIPVVILTLLAILPLTLGEADNATLTLTVSFAVAGLSVVLLTGIAGQVSLGQWAIAGVGAYTVGLASLQWHWNVLPALLLAAVAGAAGSLVIGIPALRLRGLYLGLASLALAVAAHSWLFQTSLFAAVDKGAGSGQVARPRLLGDSGVSLFGNRAFAYLALGVLAVTALLVAVVRSGRVGRQLAAVRENERAAAAFGINIVAAKLTAFSLSGAIAGLAGGLYAYGQGGPDQSDFTPSQSFLVLAVAIVGGVGTISGPIVGASLLIALPAVFSDAPVVGLLASGAGVLIIVQNLPGGLVSLALRVREIFLDDTDPVEAVPGQQDATSSVSSGAPAAVLA